MRSRKKIPPHIHRRNAAGRAICTFQNHFLAGLASVDPDFPIQVWGQTPAAGGNHIKFIAQ